MNLVVMMGRPVKDPEVRYSAGAKGTTIAKYRIAVDRRFKREGQPDADFFHCVSFGKVAEFIEKYVHKGTKIVITGELQNNNFKGSDGNMVYQDQIVVSSVEFAESKSSADQRAANAGSGNGPLPETDANGFMNIPDGIDEELPFT